MSAVNDFDAWYEKLSLEEKRDVVLHIVNNKFRPLNEGYYGGPSGILTRGLYAGPSGQTQTTSRCPVCGK